MTLIKRSQQGFSLVELLIAMAIGLVIVGMLGAAYLSSATNNRSIIDHSLITENGRYASQVLNDEVQMAGFYGVLDFTPKKGVATPDLCMVTAASLLDGMSLPIYGFNNVTAAFNNLDGCLPAGDSVKVGTDVLVLRRSLTDVATGALDNKTFYIQTSPLSVTLDLGSASFELKEKDGVTLRPIRRFVQNIFYVSAVDNQLKKLELSEDSYEVTPIADNIDVFQLEFGIDYSGNGAPNEKAGADNFLASVPDNSTWQDVVFVRGYILAASTNNLLETNDTKTYVVGNIGANEITVGPFNDRVRRRLFYFSARANNISMRRES